MRREEVRQIVRAQFYQSLAEQGRGLASLSEEELEALTTALADALFAVLEQLEEEESQAHYRAGGSPAAATVPARPPVTEEEEEEEVLLWSGKPYLSIGTRYELTNQRLRVIRGLLGRSIEEIELVRVRDTSAKQNMTERALNIGDITVVSNDPKQPELVLHNVKDPLEVREQIRRAVLAEQKRRGLRYREEM